MSTHGGSFKDLKDLIAIQNKAGGFYGSFQRKGGVLAFVKDNENLKDLRKSNLLGSPWSSSHGHNHVIPMLALWRPT